MIKTFTKIAAAAALVVTVVTVGTQPTKAMYQSKDIIGVAEQAGSFNTLIAAVKAAGLEETLGSKGPFTVFAPTDEAFAKLPAGTVENLLKPENKDKLVAVLTYHVLPYKVTAAQVDGKTLSPKTVQGSALSINGAYSENGEQDVRVDDATVVKADVLAKNGIIHVIDRVVLPK